MADGGDQHLGGEAEDGGEGGGGGGEGHDLLPKDQEGNQWEEYQSGGGWGM